VKVVGVEFRQTSAVPVNDVLPTVDISFAMKLNCFTQMVRGGANLNFSSQICQAEIDPIEKKFVPARGASVHNTVDELDKNRLCLQNSTYPHLWIIFAWPF